MVKNKKWYSFSNFNLKLGKVELVELASYNIFVTNWPVQQRKV